MATAATVAATMRMDGRPVLQLLGTFGDQTVGGPAAVLDQPVDLLFLGDGVLCLQPGQDSAVLGLKNSGRLAEGTAAALWEGLDVQSICYPAC